MTRHKLPGALRPTVDAVLEAYLAEHPEDGRRECSPTPRAPISAIRLVFSRAREAAAFDRFRSGTTTAEDDEIIKQRLSDYDSGRTA